MARPEKHELIASEGMSGFYEVQLSFLVRSTTHRYQFSEEWESWWWRSKNHINLPPLCGGRSSGYPVVVGARELIPRLILPAELITFL